MNNLTNHPKELRKQLLKLSNKISFYKEILIDMSNNLINLHKLKIFEGLNHGYSDIVDELTNIKNKLKKYPDFFKQEYVENRKITITDLEKELNCLWIDLHRITKYIIPSDIKTSVKLILGNNWENNFKHFEISQIELLSRLFNCISCCDISSNADIGTDFLNHNNKRDVFGKETIVPLIEENMKTSSIVISDINAFPMFIKSLSELIIKEKKKLKDRTTQYNFNELIKLFNKQDNIIYIKNENINTNSLIEEKNGFIILLKLGGDNIQKLEKLNDTDPDQYLKSATRILIFQGFAKDDTMELYKTNNYIYYKYKQIREHNNNQNILFKDNYMKILNVRDILINSPEDISIILKKRASDYALLKEKQIGQLINEFLLASKYRKLEILNIFLCGDNNDIKLAYILYDILRMKDKKDVVIDVYNALPAIFKVKLDEAEIYVNKDEENLIKNHMGDLSYERRINLLKVPDSIKDKAIEKLKSMKGNFQGDNKAQSWLDGFLKIPFGIYRENSLMNYKKNQIKSLGTNLYSCNEITNYINNGSDNNLKKNWTKYMTDKSDYLKMVHNKLDEVVYGHKEAKLQLERLFAQWLNGETKGAIIGLCGPPGTGKTSLAKNGLSKCLIDDNGKNRPFAFLPIGGSVNGSTLVGHNYTYVGSTWGRIVDILITTECMNPIIFIDEVDKISSTDYGKEIIAILTHLTDATQNDNFEDKYFSGIPLDLSKALIVFSFNDASLLDPILRDRITIIETKPYTIQEKVHIITNYMIPEILKDVGFSKDEIIFSEDIIKYLINTYTNEAGVRKIKEKIVEIIRDINLKHIHNHSNENRNYEYYSHEYYVGDNKITLPYTITINYVDEIFKMKPKMRINKTHSEPMIGLVNGLYATTTGVGGLTPIQVMKYPSDKMLDLTLTGQQGDVMKESVTYALRIAYNMLSDEEKQKILDDANNKRNFGLLVHTPEAATKKDGPSAGAAMTLAIYSVLTNKKINHEVAMTGEIDLYKNVKMIGGLHAKLSGAKTAGIKLALIPKENLDDLNILRHDNISPEDDTFKVELIDIFDDLIKHCIM